MAPSAENDGLTAWERRRAENAKANNEILSNISKTSAKIFSTVPAPTKKKPTAPRKRAEPVKREPAIPTRRSARVAGADADPEILKRKLEVDAEAQAQQGREKRTRVSGDLKFSDIQVDGRTWQGSLDGLSKIYTGAQTGVRTFTDEDVEETTDVGLKNLRKEMNNLKLYETFEVKGESVGGAIHGEMAVN